MTISERRADAESRLRKAHSTLGAAKLEADSGEAPEYDGDEARDAIATSQELVMPVAEQLGIAGELRTLDAAHAVAGSATQSSARAPGANNP